MASDLVHPVQKDEGEADRSLLKQPLNTTMRAFSHWVKARGMRIAREIDRALMVFRGYFQKPSAGFSLVFLHTTNQPAHD